MFFSECNHSTWPQKHLPSKNWILFSEDGSQRIGFFWYFDLPGPELIFQHLPNKKSRKHSKKSLLLCICWTSLLVESRTFSKDCGRSSRNVAIWLRNLKGWVPIRHDRCLNFLVGYTFTTKDSSGKLIATCFCWILESCFRYNFFPLHQLSSATCQK